MILEGLDPLGLASTVVNADANEAEPPGFDAYEQGGALPVAGTTPALAEGITGIEPASEAEKAIVARPEALVPWAQDKARHGHEVDAQPHKALPQKGKRNTEALPQEVQQGDKGALETLPRTHECKPDWLPREVSHEDTQSTWEVGNTGQEIETPPRKGELKAEALPQRGPNKGKSARNVPP